MMNVDEYYLQGNKVFVTPKLPFTQIEYDFINTLFRYDYRFSIMEFDNQATIDTIVQNLIAKNYNYYNAIKESYKAEFNPLKNINVTNTREMNRTDSGETTDETTYNTTNETTDKGTVTRATTGTTANTGTVTNTDENTHNDTVTHTGTDNTVNVISTRDETVNTQKSPVYNDGGNLQTDTQNENTLNKSGSTSADRTVNLTDKTTSTDNGNSTTTNDLTTTTNDNETNTTDRTNTAKHTGTDTRNGSTSNTANENETYTQEGYSNIDYMNAIRAIYETRKINLYDILMRDVYNIICSPFYEF